MTFRQAIEKRDPVAVAATLAPEVVFHSPIVHKPYHGRDTVAALLRAVMRVMGEHFRYTAEYSSSDSHVLRFETRVGERDLEGVDILTFDEAGLIRDFTVMVRPYSAATALREQMMAELA